MSETKTMNAMEALAIVAKDETKVAHPKSLIYYFVGRFGIGNRIECVFFCREGFREGEPLTDFILSPYGVFDLAYFLSDVEWEVLDKSAVLSRSEVGRESEK